MTQLPSGWRFKDPPNVAVYSTRSVVAGEMPILRVSHDEDDGAWQFLDGQVPRIEERKVVSLAYILKLDPTVEGVADLPLGWIATRATAEDSWVRVRRMP